MLDLDVLLLATARTATGGRLTDDALRAWMAAPSPILGGGRPLDLLLALLAAADDIVAEPDTATGDQRPN